MAKMNGEVRWYALKVFFNKVFDMEQLLKILNVETYIPVCVVEKVKDGEMCYIQKPAISSLMFFCVDDGRMEEVQRTIEGRAMIYHHNGTRKPAPIPDQEMRVFKLVTAGHKSGLEYFDGDVSRFCRGQRVRVIDGSFKGAEGYIHRIKGNRRLIVTIEGVVAVATTYIPSVFLEPVN